VVSALLLAVLVGFLFVELRPDLLLSGTVPMQGDTSNHLYTAFYLAHGLLPHAHLMGWSPGWFRGYPAFTFYFLIPNLLIALVSMVLPFAVAFKLVSVVGILSLPVAGWGMAKLAGYKDPVPVAVAAAMLPFLFERSYSIFGGNIASTISGEYSESIALALAVLALGVAARGLTTGRLRALFAGLVALVILCHVLVAAFLVAGVCILFFLRVGRAAARWLLTCVALALATASFWLVPYVARIGYSPNARSARFTSYLERLFPFGATTTVVLHRGSAELVPFFLIFLVGVLGAVVSWKGWLAAPSGPDRLGACFSVLALLSALVFVFAPSGIDQTNGKALPFWFLSIYVLAALGVVQAGAWLGLLWRRSRPGRAAAWSWADRRTGPKGASAQPRASLTNGAATRSGYPVTLSKPGAVVAPVVICALALSYVVVPLRISFLSWVPGTPSAANASGVPAMIDKSFAANHGLASWPEFRAVVQTASSIGQRYGCGTALWSFDSDQRMDNNGWALGGLPYWTNGCVSAAMGILIESSASAPSILQAMDNLSETTPFGPAGKPSRSHVNLRLGVEQLQALGIRYFMTSDPGIVRQADHDGNLRPVGTTGPWRSGATSTPQGDTWHFYLVRGSAPVVPVSYQPTVLTGISTRGQQWIAAGHAWFSQERLLDALYTADGPPGWLRANPAANVTLRRQPAVRVSNVRQTDNSISFDVDRTGVPVLVKVSYFPNWQVTGATGPYRALPNLMVVVPRTRHVTLHYGHTPLDYLGWLLTFFGCIGIVYVWTVGSQRARRSGPQAARRPWRPAKASRAQSRS